MECESSQITIGLQSCCDADQQRIRLKKVKHSSVFASKAISGAVEDLEASFNCPFRDRGKLYIFK